MKKKSTTLKDVANACGVSSTAVSLALNGKPSNLSEKTKQFIIDTANSLGYRPDPTARSLATKKTNTIGVIIPDISNAFFSEAVRHIQIDLAEYGYDMFLCNSEEKFENDVKYLELLVSRNVDGLIITMSAESMTIENQNKINRILKESKTPYILFDRYYDSDDASKVYVDNDRSGYVIAQYLIESGHRKIGVITGPLVLNSSQERLNGVIRAMKEANLELLNDHIVTGHYDMETGKKGAKQLLKDVTAIFAFNDLQAFGVIETAKEMGIKIPDEVSLVGFDDIFYASILETKLTTVRQPIVEMSKEIASLIIRMIKEPTFRSHKRMNATLIKRDSVKKID